MVVLDRNLAAQADAAPNYKCVFDQRSAQWAHDAYTTSPQCRKTSCVRWKVVLRYLAFHLYVLCMVQLILALAGPDIYKTHNECTV